MRTREIECRGRAMRTAIVLLFAGCCCPPIAAQSDSSAFVPGRYVTTLPSSRYLQPVILFRLSDQPLAGHLLDVRNDDISILSNGAMDTVPLRDALKLTFPNLGKNPWEVPICGAAGGFYLGLLNQAENGYLPKDFLASHYTSTLLYAIIAASSFYYIGSSGDTGRDFWFVGDDVVRTDEEAVFRAFIRGEDRRTRWHFSFQISDVHPAEQNRSAGLLRAAGFDPLRELPYSWNYDPDYADVGTVRVLRKAQVLYSVLPKFSAGVAYMSLTERSRQDGSSFVSDTLSTAVIISLDPVAAYYLVGSYEPLGDKIPKPLEWRIGFGLGYVSREGMVTSARTRSRTTYFTMTTAHPLDGGAFSMLAFTDFNVYLFPSISLGLTAEYVSIAKFSFDAIRDINTTRTSINLGSTSWGLVIGIHL